MIPKGTSLEGYTQEDIALLMDHINSYSRNQRAFFTPFDLVEKAYPDLIQKLGLKRINPDDAQPFEKKISFPPLFATG
ncbi:MAG TPA: hypothetical protein VFC41_01285 [Anaerovoracaceae bacterium]|nr:hypothetical protein [Anaerovoracaceae bacterium]